MTDPIKPKKSTNLTAMFAVVFVSCLIFITLAYGYGLNKATNDCNDYYYSNAEKYIENHAKVIMKDTGYFFDNTIVNRTEFIKNLNYTS